MTYMCRGQLFFRDRCRCILTLAIAFSISTNIVFLLSKQTQLRSDSLPLICSQFLNRVGGHEAIERIEKDTNIKASVKDLFMDEVKQCLQNRGDVQEHAKTIEFVLQQLTLRENVQNESGLKTANNSTELSPQKATDKEIKLFLSQPIITPHEYSYILNQPHACLEKDVKYVIAVPSAPGNLKNRMKVRANQGGTFSRDAKNKAKLLFFLGTTAGSEVEVQKSIEAEEKEHKDIVQADFVDSYRNITKKAALLLRWSSEFCNASTYVLRMDDDLRVDLSKMARAMEETNKGSNDPLVVLGNLRKDWGPVRSKNSKYYTSLEEYPHKKLPNFILGGSMGYSVRVADLLFKAYQRLTPFWLDDVFLTGMCAPKVGVTIRDSDAFAFQHWKW